MGRVCTSKQDSRCIISGELGPDRHHIKTKKSGGSDEETNLMPLSRKYHVEVHTMGMVRFSRKYPQVKVWLESNGWEFSSAFGREKWGMA